MSQSQPTPNSHAIKSKSSSCLFTVLLLICCVSLIYIPVLGQVTTLTCERVAPGGRVNCVVQKTLLSLVPLGQYDIIDLRGANVSESVDQEGDLSHRIELITAQGVIPLTPSYYPGSGSYQRDMATRINGFVHAATPGTLIVTEYPLSGLPTQQP